MMEKEVQEKLKRAVNVFSGFVFDFYALGFDSFITGEHIKNTADFLQSSNRTIRISAKDHFKSASLYAFFLWQSLRNPYQDLEYHYFSYQQDMAAYHLKKLKLFKLRIPLFNEMKDLKELADSVCKYTWDGRHFHTMEPHGLLAFKRGLHGNALVDDPFQDPTTKIAPKTVRNINYIIKSQIFDIPHKKDVLHIVGTPQTREDFFFDEELTKRFKVKIMPAIKSDGLALWPEWMDLTELEIRRKERGDKIFNQEYMCSPVYLEDAFFNMDQLDAVTRPEYMGVDSLETDNDVIAGFDIGKHAHPSHFAIFEVIGNEWKMVHQKFMDGWKYIDQIEYIKDKEEKFGIDTCHYDATRGELEGLEEKGDLPDCMEPVNLNLKKKADLAREFEKAVTQKKIIFIDNARMRNQILAVTNDLKAMKTEEGHGDSFWSIALCFNDLTKAKPEMYISS